MISFFYRHILLPAFEDGFKRRKTFRYWNELEKSQWLPRPQLESIQLDSLKNLAAHAFKNCPYYQKTWTQLGLNPTQLKSHVDFYRWPVIDREIISENRDQMRTQVPDTKLIAKATGGSSGVPLRFDLDENSNDRRMAAWHRGYSWAGAAPGTKQLYLWGVPLGELSRLKRAKDAVYNGIYRRLVLNSFELREATIPEFYRRLQAYRPDVIVAYTNPIYSFATMLQEQGLKPYSPKSIVVGAEKLHPFQRERIEEVFQAPVFETYGSREFMLMGGECDRHEGLHLTTEQLLIEVLDDEGRPTPDGEEGNVVVTDLYNYGMPFIRYINNDRAIAGFGNCSCGRGLPLLKKVVGRRLDMLRTPDGRLVPGEFFPHLMKDFAAVRQFQVIQEQPDLIRLSIVLKSEWTEQDQQKLDHEVRKIIGHVIRFEVCPTEEIPLTAAGKLQIVINRCSSDLSIVST